MEHKAGFWLADYRTRSRRHTHTHIRLGRHGRGLPKPLRRQGAASRTLPGPWRPLGYLGRCGVRTRRVSVHHWSAPAGQPTVPLHDTPLGEAVHPASFGRAQPAPRGGWGAGRVVDGRALPFFSSPILWPPPCCALGSRRLVPPVRPGALLELAVRRRRTFQAPHYGSQLQTRVILLGSALWIAATQAVIHFPLIFRLIIFCARTCSSSDFFSRVDTSSLPAGSQARARAAGREGHIGHGDKGAYLGVEQRRLLTSCCTV